MQKILSTKISLTKYAFVDCDQVDHKMSIVDEHLVLPNLSHCNNVNSLICPVSLTTMDQDLSKGMRALRNEKINKNLNLNLIAN